VSLSYTLSIKTGLSLEAALQAIAALPGFVVQGPDFASAPGADVLMSEADEEDKESVLRREGFEPTLMALLVEHHREARGETATSNIVRATIELLRHGASDAVLRDQH